MKVQYLVRSLLPVVVSTFVAGCAFLPGFGLFETPTLYYVDVAEVAAEIACEMRDFIDEHNDDLAYAGQKWALSEDDIKVVLTLTADEAGYVNFTGINVTQLGFSSLQAFITSTTTNGVKVPTLTAKMTGKRSKVVTTTFTVSAKSLLKEVGSGVKHVRPEQLKTPKLDCSHISAANPISSLFLKDYLNNYFDTINYSGRNDPIPEKQSISDRTVRVLRRLHAPLPIPEQLKIQSVQLSTAFTLMADVSAGAAPTVLGDGTVFIVPINGLGIDYNPDYIHKIDMTFNICDQTEPTCNQYSTSAEAYRQANKKAGKRQNKDDLAIIPLALLKEQCHAYAVLKPLLTNVSPPKDYESGSVQMRCSPDGTYHPVVPQQRPQLDQIVRDQDQRNGLPERL